ncbi:hypothetical protein SprV_0301120500 [Sparganum proliferum]
MLCDTRSNRPERRTALVDRELARYRVDIAALNETLFSEQGQLEEVGASYTLFWSGRPRAERRDAGVTFAIWNDIVRRLPYLPQDINHRLMSFRLPLQGGKFANIVSVYAPPMTSPDEAKNKYYEDLNLLAEKNHLHKSYVDHLMDNRAAYYRSHRLLKQRLSELEDAWTACKAEKIEGYADRNKWKIFFAAIKAVYDPSTKATAPLLSADGSTYSPRKHKFYSDRPSTSEVSTSVHPPSPTPPSSLGLKWRPTSTSTPRPLSTKQSEPCSSSPAEKRPDHTASPPRSTITIFTCILLNRLNNRLEHGPLPESQCGLRRHRGTTDIIVAARQQQEKCQEMRTHLYTTFVDLTKASDAVSREGLWKIIQKFGCPARFTPTVGQLHNGMMARVTDNAPVSEAFAVTDGVKQGCVLAPTLFSLKLSTVLMDAYRDQRPGIYIAHRADVHLLNQRRMHFQSRAFTTTVHELLFADDCALNATTEGDMQRSMHLFAAACENFGFIINTDKTVVMHQPPPNTAHNSPQSSVNGTHLKVVDNFTYLGSTLCRSTKIDDEVACRISKAS